MPDPWFQGMFEGGHEKTKELARHYAALAAFFKVDFLDAGSVISTVWARLYAQADNRPPKNQFACQGRPGVKAAVY